LLLPNNMVGVARLDSYLFRRHLLLKNNLCFLQRLTRVFFETDLGFPSEHRLFVHRLLPWHQRPYQKVIVARLINDNKITLKGLPEKL
jgi:predicted membrane-bound spermidine synthase